MEVVIDPDELLRRILDLINEHELAQVNGRAFNAEMLATELCEKVYLLDDWLRRGGYIPDRWARAGVEPHP